MPFYEFGKNLVRSLIHFDNNNQRKKMIKWPFTNIRCAIIPELKKKLQTAHRWLWGNN